MKVIARRYKSSNVARKIERMFAESLFPPISMEDITVADRAPDSVRHTGVANPEENGWVEVYGNPMERVTEILKGDPGTDIIYHPPFTDKNLYLSKLANVCQVKKIWYRTASMGDARRLYIKL